MRYELPPQAVLEDEVRGFNRRFLELAKQGQQQGPFVFEPRELKPVGMGDSTTTAAFWKHFIGGSVNAIRVMLDTAQQDSEQFPVNEDLIRSVQMRSYSRTREWQAHPNNRNTPLERESYDAFLAVCTSFDWSASSSELMIGLNVVVQDIGDTYTMLEGKLPLRMIMHNLQEEGKV